MEAMTVQIRIPTNQYSLLEELATQRQMLASDALKLALAEWLERETRLQKAREIMQQLGDGLGEGQPPHDAAQNHDVYLYGKRQSR